MWRLCAPVAESPRRCKGAKHHRIDGGAFIVKWESHTEFTAITIFAANTNPDERPFAHPASELAPKGWLQSAPGAVIAAVHAHCRTGLNDLRPVPEDVAPFFDPESVAGGVAGNNLCRFWGDFRMHEDGFTRFFLQANAEIRPESLGRLTQRLIEIETYRAASMLALPMARGLWSELTRIDEALAAAAGDMVGSHEDERARLDHITELSAELEHATAESAFRFSAAHAYEAIVWDRIDMLNPQPVPGLARLPAFMRRRYDPAMRSCEATAVRLETLSRRAARAAELLRARVEVAMEEQNRALLESMDRRAALQLRLQETVEGLSVVAISYYAASLGVYLFGPLGKWAGLGDTWMKALIVLPTLAAVWWSLKCVKARLARAEEKAG